MGPVSAAAVSLGHGREWLDCRDSPAVLSFDPNCSSETHRHKRQQPPQPPPPPPPPPPITDPSGRASAPP